MPPGRYAPFQGRWQPMESTWTLGATLLALATALSGGTVRDLCPSIHLVFWVSAPSYLIRSLLNALGTFILAWRFKLPKPTLSLADSFVR